MTEDHLGPIPGSPDLLPIGYGFGRGFAVRLQPGIATMPGSTGQYYWSGAAGTSFWVDPKEELAVVFMTQVIGSDARLTLRRDLRTMVYAAMTEQFA